MTKLEHALDAASRGLPVFPQDGKRPSIRNWPANASTSIEVITRWWKRWPDADIGIALPEDIYVLDADTPAAANVLIALGLIDTTLTVATARGSHMYFRVPHPLARKTPVPAATGFAAVEGKGTPGPVTWAGSVHPTGFVYTISFDAPIAWMPGELVRAIGPRRARTESGVATPDERAEWNAARARVDAMASASLTITPSNFAASELLTDAAADMRMTLRALRYDLPEMQTGWADRFFRAAAYLGPHVATGGLDLDETIQELVALFTELNTDGGPPDHVTRSIERGIATGARGVKL